MFKFFDAYSLRARLFPALLAILPALAALAILISWSKFGLTNFIATAAIPVLVYASADIARRFGKKIEKRIYGATGGKPSVTMLRHSDSTFDAAAKAQYRAFLSSMIEQPSPTKQLERDNPEDADAFYERCGAWLRENTRSAKKFPILFNENITYGFRRNLFGLKWPALSLNSIIILLCVLMLYRKGVIDFNDDLALRLLIVLAFAIIHAIYMAFGVTKQSVVDASRTYARQLILSCETFLGKKKSKARRPVSTSRRDES